MTAVPAVRGGAQYKRAALRDSIYTFRSSMMATKHASGVDGAVGCHQELAAAVAVIRCVVPTRGVVSADGDLSAGTNMLAAARCGRANRPRRGSGQNTDRAAVSSVPPRVKSPAGLWLDDAWRSQVESGLRAHGRGRR